MSPERPRAPTPGERCCICLDVEGPISFYNYTQCQQCRQLFHPQCISLWRVRKSRCPHCQSDAALLKHVLIPDQEPILPRFPEHSGARAAPRPSYYPWEPHLVRSVRPIAGISVNLTFPLTYVLPFPFHIETLVNTDILTYPAYFAKTPAPVRPDSSYLPVEKEKNFPLAFYLIPLPQTWGPDIHSTVVILQLGQHQSRIDNSYRYREWDVPPWLLNAEEVCFKLRLSSGEIVTIPNLDFLLLVYLCGEFSHDEQNFRQGRYRVYQGDLRRTIYDEIEVIKSDGSCVELNTLL